MHLVTYRRSRGKDQKPRVGVLLGSRPASSAVRELPGETADGYVLDCVRYGRVEGLTLPTGLREVLEQKLLTGLKSLVAAFRRSYRADPKRCRRYLTPVGSVSFLPPIPDPEKIILVGRNYREHCEEGSADVPKAPVIFSKFPTSLIGVGDRIVLPRASSAVDFEAELAVVIGRGGRHIPRQTALRHVAGYMPLNDVSARDMQFSDGQWIRGKSCDTFCPCGPALVTADEIKNPQRLGVKLVLNGTVMQDARTSEMIFGVAFLISYLSKVITLRPGDILATGTPSGVGYFRDPPVLLKPGDEVQVRIEKVGVLTNPVVAEKGRR